MRILILEHLCVNAGDTNEGTLAEEGFAMVRAAFHDFARLKNVEVRAAMHTYWKQKAEADGITVLTVSTDAQRLASEAASFGGVLLIAPEIDGIALRWAKLLEDAGAKLLGPSSEFIEWASDKFAVAQSLPARSPQTMLWSEHSDSLDWGDQVVLKPRDGVGALFTMVVPKAMLADAARLIRSQGFNGDLIIQQYVRGRSVSVSVVPRSPERFIILPAVEQIIEATEDPLLPGVKRLTYQGGLIPIEGISARVHVLATSVFQSSPPPNGWIGIDMVLSEEGRDVVVDVNPRLTTSYLGYSSLFPETTARLLAGQETDLDLELLSRPTSRRIQFDVNGELIDAC